MHPINLQHLLEQAIKHLRAGQLEDAATLYARLRGFAPECFEAFHHGGDIALRLGQFAEAEKLLKAAISLNPKSAPTFMCLGLTCSATGQSSQAENNLRHALKLDPQNVQIWVNLASILVVNGKIEEAVETCRQCIKVKPDCAQAWAGLGFALHLLGRSFEAIENLDKALSLDPGDCKARFCRALAFLSTHRLEEALAHFDARLKQNPDDLEARSYRLLVLNYSSKSTRSEVYAAHKTFGELAHAAAKKRPASKKIAAPKLPDAQGRLPKLSVAFLSPDLRMHSVAFFLEPLLQHLDRSQFEITLYHDHFVVDDTSRRLQALADHWRNFIGQPHDVVEERIRSDAPDILVDLAGHSGFNRMPLYAKRLAPVQITYLGYPSTTGLAEMDFKFTDTCVDPEESEAFHTEKLVRFSSTAWCYAPPSHAPKPIYQPDRPPTFGSFNNLSKLSIQTLRLWAEILKRSPASRLFLKGAGLQADRVSALLGATGIPMSRVELAPATSSHADHLATYNAIDVALDTTPYGGTTTTCEALWMGVPVISLRGDRHAARVGASLLNSLGHPEWVANSEAEYIEKAVRLASNRAVIASLRTRLRDEMNRSILLDHARQACRFGDALTACYRQKVFPQT
jgi:predicted O-linked N-acetylglucosamine transferase (SPINDLY family)